MGFKWSSMRNRWVLLKLVKSHKATDTRSWAKPTWSIPNESHIIPSVIKLMKIKERNNLESDQREKVITDGKWQFEWQPSLTWHSQNQKESSQCVQGIKAWNYYPRILYLMKISLDMKRKWTHTQKKVKLALLLVNFQRMTTKTSWNRKERTRKPEHHRRKKNIGMNKNKDNFNILCLFSEVS